MDWQYGMLKVTNPESGTSKSADTPRVDWLYTAYLERMESLPSENLSESARTGGQGSVSFHAWGTALPQLVVSLLITHIPKEKINKLSAEQREGETIRELDCTWNLISYLLNGLSVAWVSQISILGQSLKQCFLFKCVNVCLSVYNKTIIAFLTTLNHLCCVFFTFLHISQVLICNNSNH